MKIVVEAGTRIGKLTVLPRKDSDPIWGWNCLCDCGNITFASNYILMYGRRKSCGCLRLEVTTKHGKEGTLIYTTWAQMKARCLNTKHKAYKDYGGRGITVCDRWLEFKNFYSDMGEKPKGFSLDRINNNLGYSPENCKWSNQVQQLANRRNTAMLEYNGVVKPRTEWAREYGISWITLRSRILLGWDMHKSLTTPIDKRKASRKPKP